MQAFVGAAPAVIEVATLERIFALLEGVWDPILVDADATGHARMFLGLPAVFEELGAGGPLALLLARTERLFADPEIAALHLVTLPGALPVEETLELDAELARGGHVALGAVLVSRAPKERGLDAARIRALAAHARDRGARDVAADLEHLGAVAAREREDRVRIDAMAERIAARSSAADRPVIDLPRLEGRAGAAHDHEALRALGRVALAGIAEREGAR
jgi:arsenite-transporting ATPase